MPRLTRRLTALTAALALVGAGCAETPSATPPIVPGTAAQPRPVVLLLKDYEFIPKTVDLVPGETVVLQVVDGGLVAHEAVLGPMAVQDAWEAAEGPTVSAPPGPTPAVSVDPALGGLRIVVGSGERKDVIWTVPLDIGTGAPWLIGCHIPGHWAKGMVAGIRLVGPGGAPLGTDAGGAAGSPAGVAPSPS